MIATGVNPSLAEGVYVPAQNAIAASPHIGRTAGDGEVKSKVASLRFVTTDDFPPYSFLDGQGNLTGYNVELARRICETLVIACTIQVRPFALMVQTLREDKADASIAGIKDTPALRHYLAYTMPYLRLPARFVTARSGVTIDGPDSLAGKTVAVASHGRYEDFLTDFFPRAQRAPMASTEDALAAVKAGKVDAAFAGAVDAAFWMAGPSAADCCRFSGGVYTEAAYFGDGMTIAVAAGNDDLRRVLDGAIASLDSDGTLADLAARFFPADLH